MGKQAGKDEVERRGQQRRWEAKYNSNSSTKQCHLFRQN